MNKIISFTGEYRFLSNFYPCFVEMKSIIYPSVEHAYQASKTFNEAERAWILSAPSPTLAKKRGKKITLREDWEEVKLKIMKELINRKFKDPSLQVLLKKTGDAELIEENWWGDTFWGIYQEKGENHLGKILMEIRAKL